jgi:hypothetical protein
VATSFLCPICGALPGDNGTSTQFTNNAVNSASDAVVTASGVISSTSGTTLIVSTGANFTVFPIQLSIPTRNETMVATSKSTNTLTVTRASALVGGNIVPSGTPSGSIAIADVVLTGNDVNGQPVHCPICGTAAVVVNLAAVTTFTSVGTPHPVDVDATYMPHADSPLAQFSTSPYTPTGRNPLQMQKFGVSPGNWSTPATDGEPTVWNTSANSINRGDAHVTAETINGTVGP